MAKVSLKGSVLLSPLPPTMVTCKNGEEENIITIAWTGVINSQPPKTYISVRPTRHSYEMIKQSGVFAINLVSKDLVKACDGCGVYTGAKVNKFEKYHLAKEPAKEIDCPILSDAPITLECKVCSVTPYGSHDMFLADIVAVDVNEELIDADGKMDFEKANLVAYMHGDYYALGKQLGKFGFSATKKKKLHKAQKQEKK